MEKWVLAHSAKGTTWSKHKYIKKVGNRYYYKSDINAAKAKMKAADSYNASMKNNPNAIDKAEIKLKYANDVYEIEKSKINEDLSNIGSDPFGVQTLKMGVANGKAEALDALKKLNNKSIAFTSYVLYGKNWAKTIRESRWRWK